MQKIMFNDKYGLTQAVVNGKKTMTRRESFIGKVDDGELSYGRYFAFEKRLYPDGELERFVLLKKSKFKIGEIVAIAQPYEVLANSGQLDKMVLNANNAVGFELKKEYCGAGWENKMFVKAELMPHHIIITDIKLENLQDISEEDCLKEGVFQFRDHFHEDRVEGFGFFGATKHYLTAKEAFAALIDKVSGKGTWNSNQYVFAYDFELVD